MRCSEWNETREELASICIEISLTGKRSRCSYLVPLGREHLFVTRREYINDFDKMTKN